MSDVVHIIDRSGTISNSMTPSDKARLVWVEIISDGSQSINLPDATEFYEKQRQIPNREVLHLILTVEDRFRAVVAETFGTPEAAQKTLEEYKAIWREGEQPKGMGAVTALVYIAPGETFDMCALISIPQKAGQDRLARRLTSLEDQMASVHTRLDGLANQERLEVSDDS